MRMVILGRKHALRDLLEVALFHVGEQRAEVEQTILANPQICERLFGTGYEHDPTYQELVEVVELAKESQLQPTEMIQIQLGYGIRARPAASTSGETIPEMQKDQRLRYCSVNDKA